jgi:hypothetical protein
MLGTKKYATLRRKYMKQNLISLSDQTGVAVNTNILLLKFVTIILVKAIVE